MARECANSALKDSLNYAPRTLFRCLPGFIAHNDARSRSVRMCDRCLFFPFFKGFFFILFGSQDSQASSSSDPDYNISPAGSCFPHPIFLLKFSSALCGHFALLLQQLPFVFGFFFFRVCVHLTAPVQAPGLPVELHGPVLFKENYSFAAFAALRKIAARNKS